MSVNASGSFSDLKEMLKESDMDMDDEIPIVPHPVKVRIHELCSDFLGGVWKNVGIEDIALVKMCGGMSNLLFLCRLPPDRQPLGQEPDKVLLRIYFNPETESHLVAESVIFTLLSEQRLGPRLFGIFNGGRLEEYIESRPLLVRDMMDPAKSAVIASKVAGVHKLSVPISKEPTYLCDAMNRWITHLLQTIGELHAVNVRCGQTTRVMDSMAFRCEVETIRACLEKTTSPVIFCHNDLQEGNILLARHPASGDIQLVLIDFEYASYNFRAFDFANHFCEWAIDYESKELPGFRVTPENFPTRDQQAFFCREYLKTYMESDNLTRVDPVTNQTIDLVDEMLAEIKPFIAISHFFWSVWALLQVELSPINFGFREMAEARLVMYFETKSDMLSLLGRQDSRSATSADGSTRVVNGSSGGVKEHDVSYCKTMFSI